MTRACETLSETRTRDRVRARKTLDRLIHAYEGDLARHSRPTTGGQKAVIAAPQRLP